MNTTEQNTVTGTAGATDTPGPPPPAPPEPQLRINGEQADRLLRSSRWQQ